MTDEPRVPAVVEHLVRTIAGGSPEDRDQRASSFARGLALGALVGAAIAGSTIWQRRLARRAGELESGDAHEAAGETAAPPGESPAPGSD